MSVLTSTTKTRFIALVLLLVPSTGVLAQSDEPLVQGNVTFTSDYVWRGISQTMEDPAVQGSLTLEAAGFHFIAWGSNVDFGSETRVEFDLDAGYTWETRSGFSWTVGLIDYIYVNESDLDTLEVYLGVGYQGLELRGYYTDDYSGVETDAYYTELSYQRPLSDRFTLGLRLGQSDFGPDSGLPDYLDYSASLEAAVLGVELQLGFYGTDLDGSPLADDRIVFAIGKTF